MDNTYYGTVAGSTNRWSSQGEFFHKVPSAKIIDAAYKATSHFWDGKNRVNHNIGCSPLFIVESKVEDSNPKIAIDVLETLDKKYTDKWKPIHNEKKWVEFLDTSTIVKMKQQGLL
jgi:hypothetical protein